MKVLIVGLGSIARKHIDALTDIVENIEIFALRSVAGAKEFDGLTNIYTLADIPEDISFCIVSNPTIAHKETIRSLIPLGKPLFIEKPVLANLSGADELLKQITENKLLTYVACNLRFHPAIQFLKKEMEIRKPLEFTSYCGSYLPEWRPEQDYRNNYSAKTDMGGGVHLDLIHEVDLCKYLLGHPLKLYSYLSKKSGLEIDSFDISHYILEYENTSAFITLNYYRRDSKRDIECVWEDETWHIDLLSNRIVNEKSDLIFYEAYNITDTYVSQMKYFIDALLSDKQPMNSFKEGLETLKLSLDEK